MTVISYTTTDESIEIVIEGHAGYAEKGKDIVCSAVSILSYSLFGELEKLDADGLVVILDEVHMDGMEAIVFKVIDETALISVDTVMNGFDALAEEYSNYVFVQRIP